MRRLPHHWLALWMVVPVWAGCATTPAPGHPGGEGDPFAAQREAVADRGEIPGAADMLQDVQMVGFPYRVSGYLWRDTIRGATRVSDHLQALRLRSEAGRVPFRLRTTNVHICEGAAVERGRFVLTRQMMPEPRPEPDRSLPYTALWRPVDDDWKIERLWLDPDASVRVRALASGCDASLRAARAGRRVRLGLGGRAGAVVDLSEVSGSVRDAGWPTPATADEHGLGVKAWLSYRITSSAAMRTEYERIGRTRLHAYEDLEEGFRSLNADVDGHRVAVLGEARVGPLWLAAGPAVAFVTTRWTERLDNPTVRTSREGETPRRLIGGTGEVVLRVGRVPTVIPFLAIGYSWFPSFDVEVMDFVAPVTAGGLSVALALELPL